MSTEIKVPDIGDFKDVDVIEVLVSPGDAVDIESPLLTLESDKASMEIPAPKAGTVTQVVVTKGSTVDTGAPLVVLA